MYACMEKRMTAKITPTTKSSNLVIFFCLREKGRVKNTIAESGHNMEIESNCGSKPPRKAE